MSAFIRNNSRDQIVQITATRISRKNLLTSRNVPRHRDDLVKLSVFDDLVH
jgi:hypothetical protein